MKTAHNIKVTVDGRTLFDGNPAITPPTAIAELQRRNTEAATLEPGYTELLVAFARGLLVMRPELREDFTEYEFTLKACASKGSVELDLQRPK